MCVLTCFQRCKSVRLDNVHNSPAVHFGSDGAGLQPRVLVRHVDRRAEGTGVRTFRGGKANSRLLD